MNITIKIVDRGNPEKYGETCGLITIENFHEYFIMATNYWTAEEYEQQWTEGLMRIKTCDSSVLISSIQNPKTSEPLINWWVLYKEESIIYVQNELLVGDTYNEYIGKNTIITRQNCYNFITPRITHTDDGYRISEWQTNI